MTCARAAGVGVGAREGDCNNSSTWSADARSKAAGEVAFSELHGDELVAKVWYAKKHRAAFTTQAWSLLAGEPRGAFELYDLAVDPSQTTDRSQQEKAVLDALSQRLSARASSVWDPQPEEHLEERETEALRALGYID